MSIQPRIDTYDPPLADQDAWQEYYAEEHAEIANDTDGFAHQVVIAIMAVGMCAGPVWVILSILTRGSW